MTYLQAVSGGAQSAKFGIYHTLAMLQGGGAGGQELSLWWGFGGLVLIDSPVFEDVCVYRYRYIYVCVY